MKFRWFLASYLSKIAAKLRRQTWYVSDTMASLPGNRAGELKQSIWERCVVMESLSENKDQEWLGCIERELDELGQLAGENWGHLK